MTGNTGGRFDEEYVSAIEWLVIAQQAEDVSLVPADQPRECGLRPDESDRSGKRCLNVGLNSHESS